MSGSLRHHGDQDREALPERHRQAGPDADRDAPGAIPVTRSADPRLASAGSATPGLLALQRSAGNAAVASLVGGVPAVQRAVQIDEITTQVDAGDTNAAGQSAAAAGATAGAGQSPASPGPVTSDGATTTITGAQVNIEAPMTQANGVLRATTVIADSIVASSYSPGAGNVW